MRYPPMSAKVELREGGFDVIVTHHIAQSFSRAVDPRAFREAKEVMRANPSMGQVACVDGDYGFEDVGDSSCRSRVVFEVQV